MTIPSAEIERILFGPTVVARELAQFLGTSEFVNFGGFKEISWLNTPGPIYTTYTDNCGTGQVEAINNVGGDEDYHEIIFKQPFNKQELKETLTVAAVDPFAAYYFDGNQNWTSNLVVEWWEKSNERIFYILERYQDELNLPEILDRPLYGPREPIPDNYKNWLDFYQNGMKEYLEWYIFKLSSRRIILNDLSFDWTKKKKLDDFLKSKKNSR